MIDKFRIQDFKAHRDTEVGLGRFTMLVGDNASGKTSVLEALAIQGFSGDALHNAVDGVTSFADKLRRGATSPMVLSSFGRLQDRPWTTRVELRTSSQIEDVEWALALSGSVHDRKLGAYFNSQLSDDDRSGWMSEVRQLIGSTPVYRLHAATIAAAAYNIHTDVTVGADGEDTAVVLAEMKLTDDDAFRRVEDSLRQLVPAVRSIKIRRASVDRSGSDEVIGNKIYFDFRGADNVPGDGASHGTLVLVSLLTILHRANRPNLILLDDFDHALHPRAQSELIRTIKQLLTLDEYRELQIVATTHSPYMLDELSVEDVCGFALRDDGTVASKPLSAHPDAAKTRGALTAGQLWSLDPERDWVLKD